MTTVKPVVNLDEVEFDDVEENGRYTSRRALFSDRIGAVKLGYNLVELPPGKVQCPFHNHHGEEEMFLILEGEGELRYGDARYPLRRHDVIACPVGGPETAHQIVNTGTVARDFTVTITYPAGTDLSIRGSWNGSAAAGGSTVTLRGGPLAPGASINAGFQAAKDGRDSSRATGCTVGGGSCRVS